MSTGSEPARPPVRQNMAAQGSVVAGMTLISRISGFARDMVFSYFFGAGMVADAFFVAFRIPNFFRRLFAEGAFNQAFVPVLARYRRERPEEFHAFVAAIAGNLTVAVVAVVVLGILLAPGLIALFAPGFRGAPEQFALATGMVRITFPYLGFISLAALAAALLNAHHRYAIPAFTPVLLNLTLIAAMLFAADLFDEPVFALAWGVLVAGIVQLAFQFPALARLGLIVAPRPNLQHPGVRQVGRLLVPAVFASSVGQINALVATILASTLTTGSISWLYYADRLLELPIGLVAVALGTVLLPNLSRLAAAKDQEGFSATLEWGVRMGLILGVPAALALYLLALPLIASIFHHGALTALDARMAGLALQAFAAGLFPLVLVKVLAPAYFAREDTRTPFRFAVVAVLTNLALNLALFSWFGHVGLALATSVAAWVNALLLLRGLAGDGCLRPGRHLYLTLARVGGASLGMAVALVWWVPAGEAWLQMAAGVRALHLLAAVTGGALVYLGLLVALGERPRSVLHRI